jgi:hypothetical protein
MKTALGWIRGWVCGGQYRESGRWVCVNCGRRGDEPTDLCYPVCVANHQGEQA